jgi:hypothetical protein
MMKVLPMVSAADYKMFNFYAPQLGVTLKSTLWGLIVVEHNARGPPN